MTNVSISGGKLTADVLGLHKIWALKSRLEIPADHISAVRRATDERVRGFRLPGTQIPGLITAGTYYKPGGKRVFWDVCDQEKTIAIELEDERFATFAIEVADPEGNHTRDPKRFGQLDACKCLTPMKGVSDKY